MITGPVMPARLPTPDWMPTQRPADAGPASVCPTTNRMPVTAPKHRLVSTSQTISAMVVSVQAMANTPMVPITEPVTPMMRRTADDAPPPAISRSPSAAEPAAPAVWPR